MTQEHKELLLKDLCARLPYKVKVQDTYYKSLEPNPIWLLDLHAQKVRLFADEGYQSIEYIKPYLFPLSSITEEQKNELIEMEWSFDNSTICNIIECFGTYRAYVDHSCCSELIDWFHKNHIDYIGLIPMGLALDATNLNIY